MNEPLFYLLPILILIINCIVISYNIHTIIKVNKKVRKIEKTDKYNLTGAACASLGCAHLVPLNWCVASVDIMYLITILVIWL